MQDSDTPTRFQIPWGNGAGGGFIRPIPQASQIAVTPGAASLTDGYPPLTFQPVASGGVPPFGQDMNGILNEVTNAIRWFQAGAPAIYDVTFQSAIGGYPKGSIVTVPATPGILYLSVTENNLADPSEAAFWLQMLGYGTAPGVNPGFWVFPAGRIRNFGNTNVSGNTLLSVNYATPFLTGVDNCTCCLGGTDTVTLLSPPYMNIRQAGSSLNNFQVANPNSITIAIDWEVWGT